MTRHPELPAGVFQPRASRQESKAETTTTAARTILDAEVKARDSKTARLRAMRMAQEAATPEPAPTKPARKAAPRKAR